MTVVEPKGGVPGLVLKSSSPANISCRRVDLDVSWKAMLGEDERDATEEEIAALEAEYGPFLAVDGEG